MFGEGLEVSAGPSGGAATDADVVGWVRAGDTAKFEILMRRHNRRLFRAARAILGDDAEAEDVVQHAYVAAFANLERYRGEAMFSTWVSRIAVNEALRRLRARNRWTAVSADAESVSGRLAAPPSPEEQASRAQLRAALEAAIDRLAPAYRTVFVMRDVEQLSTAETGAVLGLTTMAVRVRLFRARRQMRAALRRQVGVAATDAYRFAGQRCDRIVRAVLERLMRPAAASALSRVS